MIVNQAALTAMSKTFQAIFMEELGQITPDHPKIATTVPSGNRETDYAWLGNFPMLREWIGDRVVRALKAGQYSIVNKSFEATVEVDRDDIEDDNIGAYKPMIQQMSRNGTLHPDVLVFALLKAGFATACFDGQYFFDSDHPVGDASVSNTGGGSGTPWYLLCTKQAIKPLLFQSRRPLELVAQDRPDDENAFMRKKYRYGVDYRGNVGYGLWQLAYGSKQALEATYYASARAAMMSLTNEAGVPLGIVPNLLVAGPTHEAAATALIKVPTLANGAGNPWYNTCELLITPWLA